MRTTNGMRTLLTTLIVPRLLDCLMILFVEGPVRNLAWLAAVVPSKSKANIQRMSGGLAEMDECRHIMDENASTHVRFQ